MNETEQVIDGLDEVEIANTSIDEIDSENINLIFVGIDKSGSMGMYEYGKSSFRFQRCAYQFQGM